MDNLKQRQYCLIPRPLLFKKFAEDHLSNFVCSLAAFREQLFRIRAPMTSALSCSLSHRARVRGANGNVIRDGILNLISILIAFQISAPSPSPEKERAGERLSKNQNFRCEKYTNIEIIFSKDLSKDVPLQIFLDQLLLLLQKIKELRIKKPKYGVQVG